MTIPNIMEIDGEAEVGRYYLVPTVTQFWRDWKPRPWPVLLPKHEDAAIGFKDYHWHLDLRFLPAFVFKEKARYSQFEYRTILTDAAAAPLMAHWRERFRQDPNPEPKVIWRRRLCKRQMPETAWPYFTPAGEGSRVGFQKKLEKLVEGKSLRPGLICPHKGVCLKGQPVRDGVVECPAHGLRWNVETGALVHTESKVPA